MMGQYRTMAHRNVRHGLFRCANCERYLRNAKYEGEFTYVYDDNGSEKMTSVYMRCRCGGLNSASLDVTGIDDLGFYDRVDSIDSVPHRAQMIVTAPAMAETAEAT